MSGSFKVDCECGKRISVVASQAGTDVPCNCGRTISVPLLSRLRSSLGLAAYEGGNCERIERVRRAGELPWGDECAISGLPTKDYCEIKVHCEQQWANTGRIEWTRWFLFLAVLTSPFGLFRFLMHNEWEDHPVEVHGRDTFVNTPLRVRKEFEQKLRGLNQRNLLKLLRTIPVYGDLLREYPGSNATVGRHVSKPG